MKFLGLQDKEKKNALVYLVHFFLYPMNKLAVLLSSLNSLGSDDFMYCLLDGIKQTFPRSEFTFDYPAYVKSCNSEFGITVTYPNGHSFYIPESDAFFGYAPVGTKITTDYNALMVGNWYKLIKVDTKE